MNADTIKRIAAILLLLAVQVIVLNNIHLFGCATPLLLVYAIVTMPSKTPRWAILLAGFSLGLVSDMFTNTPGMAAAAMTLAAFVQQPLLRLFLDADETASVSPSSTVLGFWKYFLFSLLLTFLFCLTFFTLEEFTFFRWQQWLLFTASSTLLSTVFILAFESFRTK